MLKLSLCFTNKHYAMKAYRKVDVWIHIFLTSALVQGEWSASHRYRFTPGERAPCTQWIGGWMDPRAGMDDVEKRKFLILPGLQLQPLRHPARSQSLYRLCYHGSRFSFCNICICPKKWSGVVSYKYLCSRIKALQRE
jgi:hypothetical protein